MSNRFIDFVFYFFTILELISSYPALLFVFSFSMSVIKQLLDEAEHDIKNYSDRGQCYLPKRS